MPARERMQRTARDSRTGPPRVKARTLRPGVLCELGEIYDRVTVGSWRRTARASLEISCFLYCRCGLEAAYAEPRRDDNCPGWAPSYPNEGANHSNHSLLNSQSEAAIAAPAPKTGFVGFWRPSGWFNKWWCLYKYEPGQTFIPHRDGTYLRMKACEQSELLFLISRHEGMLGGETRFFADIEQAFRVRFGDIVSLFLDLKSRFPMPPES